MSLNNSTYVVIPELVLIVTRKMKFFQVYQKNLYSKIPTNRFFLAVCIFITKSSTIVV